MTLTRVISALATWHENESVLIGILESREVEFKRVPYRFDNEAAKLEYAKDVSGMANARGGVIVLGVETERHADAGRDVSVRVRPFPPGTVDVNQLYALAREWIYPPQREMEIREWPRADGSMLVSLRVSPTTDSAGLALVRGAEVDERVLRRFLGVAIRTDTSTEFYGHPEIYEWIRRGRLTAETVAIPGHAVPLPDEDMENARSVGGDFPTFMLQAWPASPTRLERLFDADGVRGFLSRPEVLRESGFNYKWVSYVAAEVLPSGGASYRQPGGLMLLQVSGAVTYARDASWDGLCWAMNQHSSNLIINSITLNEETIEFCRLYFERLVPVMSPLPTQVQLRIALLNTNAQPGGLSLTEGLPGRFPLGLRAVRAAAMDDLIEVVGLLSSREQPEKAAALLLRRLHERFGFGSDSIPWLTSDRSAFDIEAFLEFVRRPS